MATYKWRWGDNVACEPIQACEEVDSGHVHASNAGQATHSGTDGERVVSDKDKAELESDNLVAQTIGERVSSDKGKAPMRVVNQETHIDGDVVGDEDSIGDEDSNNSDTSSEDLDTAAGPSNKKGVEENDPNYNLKRQDLLE